MNRFAPHFGLRFRDGWIPAVEISEQQRDGNYISPFGNPVKTVYGITSQHAMSRALRWAKRHGDPRL